MASFPEQPGKASTRKAEPFWILMFKQEMTGGSGISWTICKSFAPRSRQVTTPTPQHSIFMGWMLFLLPNQQCRNTEDKTKHKTYNKQNLTKNTYANTKHANAG